MSWSPVPGPSRQSGPAPSAPGSEPGAGATARGALQPIEANGFVVCRGSHNGLRCGSACPFKAAVTRAFALRFSGARPMIVEVLHPLLGEALTVGEHRRVKVGRLSATSEHLG